MINGKVLEMEIMENSFKHILVVIPAWEPDEKMVSYVRELEQRGFENILLVDDGSTGESRRYFEILSGDSAVHVLHHEVNRGKGRSLRDGFEWCLKNMKDCRGVITADCDGQHSASDTEKMAKALILHPGEMILGTRKFDGEQVPWKSRFGNRITSFVFAVFCGKWLNDTQTGLRGIDAGLLPELCKLPGDRYEYEIRMLIFAVHKKVKFHELAIETIYLDDNRQSHFRPLQDSARIYGVIFGTFFKYLLSSLSASLIDLGIFSLLNIWLLKGCTLAENVAVSTISARIVSSLYNFSVNRKLVFRSRKNIGKAMAGYYLLAVIQMGCSAGLVYLLTKFTGQKAVLVKIIVDVFLFMISYHIQRRIIFSTHQESKDHQDGKNDC
mgnify:FL=1